MYGFLVEFRLQGEPREFAKRMVLDVAKRFRVRGVTRRGRVVPHVTLYGPAKTRDIRQVISEIQKVGRKYTLVPFTLKGFDHFNNEPKVIYINIEPSEELKQLRLELFQRLSRISTPQTWDRKPEFKFHATVAFKDIDRKFEQIWAFMKNKEEPNLHQHLLRITVLDTYNSRIICEYDLVLKKLLNRRQALSRYWRRRSINRLKQLQGSSLSKRLSLLDKLHQFFGIRGK